MIILIALFTFFLTVLVLKLLSELLTRKQRTVSHRLKDTLKGKVPKTVSLSKIPINKNTGKKVFKLVEVASVLGSITSRKYRDKIQSDLIKAGIPVKAEEMITINLFSAALAFGTGLLIFKNLNFSLIFGVIGLLLPIVWVKQLKKSRSKKIENQLLDNVILMANSLRAGHSFMQSLELASREAPPPLSIELAKVIRETRLGSSVEESLLGLPKRVDSKEMELLVTGVLIQREVGGNLAEVLDSISETIEKRIKTKGKIKALTAQGKLSAWIIGLLPFGLAAVVFGMYPEFGKIMLEEPLGIVMLVSAAGMMAIGIILIRKVVDIDV